MKKRTLVNLDDHCGCWLQTIGVFVELECGADGKPLNTPENDELVKKAREKYLTNENCR